MKRAEDTGGPRRRRASVTVLAALLCAVTAAVSGAHAEESPPQPQSDLEHRTAVVVVLDGVTLADVRAGAPGLFSAVATHGGMGLAPAVRARGDSSSLAGYVVLSSGVPVRAWDNVLAFTGLHELSEPLQGGNAGDVYARTTGVEGPGDAEGVAPGIVRFAKAADAGSLPGMVGVVGGSVREAGGRTAYVGDPSVSFDPFWRVRPGSLLAMDEAGLADRVRILANPLTSDPTGPLGVSTDVEAMLTAFEEVAVDARFTVVEIGDVRRATVEAGLSAENAARDLRRSVLRRYDASLTRIAETAGPDRFVVFVAPSPPGEVDATRAHLLPVLAMGGDVEASALLTSRSTRRPGLVTLADVTPTLIDFLAVESDAYLVGDRIGSQPVASPGSALEALAGRIGSAGHLRELMIPAFVLVQSAFVLGYAFPVWRTWGSLGTPRRTLVTLPLVLGPVLLALSPVSGGRAAVFAAIWVVVSLVLAFALARFGDARHVLVAIGLATVALVVGDVMTGTSLHPSAVLGYDLAVGGRFYGIGNETMGLLVGAATCAAAAAVDRRGPRRAVVAAELAVLFGIVVVLALPTLGANVGGTLTALVVAVVFAGMLLSDRVPPGRVLAGAGIVGAVAVAVLLAVNVATPAEGSHVGRLVARVLGGDLSAFVQTAVRKATANLIVTGTWPWRGGITVALAVTAWLVVSRRIRVLDTDARPDPGPGSRAGIVALACGALAAFALNDSGVISVVMMAPYLCALLLGLWEPTSSSGDGAAVRGAP